MRSVHQDGSLAHPPRSPWSGTACRSRDRISIAPVPARAPRPAASRRPPSPTALAGALRKLARRRAHRRRARDAEGERALAGSSFDARRRDTSRSGSNCSAARPTWYVAGRRRARASWTPRGDVAARRETFGRDAPSRPTPSRAMAAEDDPLDHEAARPRTAIAAHRGRSAYGGARQPTSAQTRLRRFAKR